MKDKQDLWELVRKKLDKENETETVSVPNKEPVKSSQEEIIREEKKDSKLQTQINKLDSNNYSVKIDSKLPNGIYMLRTSINESVTTKKISVNN